MCILTAKVGLAWFFHFEFHTFLNDPNLLNLHMALMYNISEDYLAAGNFVRKSSSLY